MMTKRTQNVIYALIFTVIAFVLPHANPELAGIIGGIFDEPLQLLIQIIGGLAGDISIYEVDITTFAIGFGVSSPLVFGLTSFVKKSPYLAEVPAPRIATILSLVVFSTLYVSRKWGFEVEFNNMTQLAVMALTLFAGTSATQIGSSAIHDKLLEGNYALAYERVAESRQADSTSDPAYNPENYDSVTGRALKVD